MGQKAPVDEKKKWDPTFSKRLHIIDRLMRIIPEFEFRAGGSTSIDVTHKGIDKSHGIRQIEKYLGFTRDEMVFVGDALMPGGNDHAVVGTGVRCISTSGPLQTLDIIEELLRL
jgi:HAD superfamily hydrolase (TIGR01484 family)